MNSERAVFYALNDTPNYLLYVKNSIKSLRLYNNGIPVYLFIYAHNLPDINFFEKHKIKVFIKNPAPDYYLTSLKWYSLCELKDIGHKSLLFLDADTICFENIDRLFDKYSGLDFYAREEITDIPQQAEYIIDGKLLKPPVLFKDIYQQLLLKYNLIKRPVYNTGVMIFNNLSYKKVVSEFNFYLHLFNEFLTRKEKLPCSNNHITEEIVSSFMFGRIADFSCDIIAMQDSPWYVEKVLGLSEGNGTVMHIWSYFYERFLKDFSY